MGNLLLILNVFFDKSLSSVTTEFNSKYSYLLYYPYNLIGP